MAKKKPTPAASATVLNIAALTALAASPNGAGFMSDADATPFLTNTPPLIEANKAFTNPNDPTQYAVRISNDGTAYLATQAANAASGSSAAQTPAPGKPVFNIIMATVPIIHRGGGGGTKESIYPFDTMPNPLLDASGNLLPNGAPSFFIPATEKRPDPAKKLASTVSSATRRTGVQDTVTPTKTIKVPSRGADGKIVKDASGNSIMVEKVVNNMHPAKQFIIRKVGPDSDVKDGAVWGFPGVTGAAIYRIK